MDTKISLRIGDTIKQRLEALSVRNNQSLSEYLRELLSDHTSEEYFDVEQDQSDVGLSLGTIVISSDPPPSKQYEKTFEFTYLVVWLFYKYMNPGETNNKAFIKTLKQSAEFVISKSSLSLELKLEFVKVLTDLNRFLVEPDYENKTFLFPLINHSLSFDYNRLVNELWSIKSKF